MESKTPVKVQLSGTNGNTLSLLGTCTKALKRAGYNAEAEELTKLVFASGSYDEALQHMMSYVDVS